MCQYLLHSAPLSSKRAQGTTDGLPTITMISHLQGELNEETDTQLVMCATIMLQNVI